MDYEAGNHPNKTKQRLWSKIVARTM